MTSYLLFTLTTTECRPFIFGRVQKLNLSLTYLNAHLASIFSFFVFVFYDGLKLESILQGKKDPLRRCDHGTKSCFAYFSLTTSKQKNSVRLNLFAGAQRADCHDEHHLQPQCGRQVLLRGQQSG